MRSAGIAPTGRGGRPGCRCRTDGRGGASAPGRLRPLPAVTANFAWAHDFVFDACAAGRQIRRPTIVDEHARECLAIGVAGSIRSRRVIEPLTQLIGTHGAPRYLRSNDGSEFASRALLEWMQQENIETALVDPAKPWIGNVRADVSHPRRTRRTTMRRRLTGGTGGELH